MANKKHRITKERAGQLVGAMKTRKAGAAVSIKNLPEGFGFDVEEIRELISHPDAKYFVVQFGWAEENQGKSSPIKLVLSVAGEDKQVLQEQADQPGTTRSMTTSSTGGRTGTRDGGTRPGGFLDEGSDWP